MITKKEFELLKYHMKQNISWREGGSFLNLDKEDKDGDPVFHAKEARQVEKILEKLAKLVK